jgi:metal-dependent amidase/aminoacylase/carboxypeptidase family protein
MLIASDLAVVGMGISFRGHTAHAAVDPWNGVNALDAVIQTFNGINALRQHVRPDVRIHGIITNGGKAANITPDFAAATFAARSVDSHYLDVVVERVRGCAEGAAASTGAELEFKIESRITNTWPNPVLEHVVAANLGATGLSYRESGHMPGSTDFGNLSQAVPCYWFTLKTHPTGTPWHSREAAELAVSRQAHDVMLEGAKVLAWSIIDLLQDPEQLVQARHAFDSMGDAPA